MATVLLYSGGLDSSCLWWIMGKPPALFIGGQYGPARNAWAGELRAVQYQCHICPEFADKLTAIQLDCRPFIRPGDWTFPRDQLCVLAAHGAGFDSAAFGWCADDGMTAGKVESAARKIRAAVPPEYPFEVAFPGWQWTKAELVTKALEAGAPQDFIDAAHSCVTASAPCGECVNCRQREGAMV